MNLFESGYVFIYVAAFGLSDYIIKKIYKNDFIYFMYYLIIFIIGLLIINKNYIENKIRKVLQN